MSGQAEVRGWVPESTRRIARDVAERWHAAAGFLRGLPAGSVVCAGAGQAGIVAEVIRACGLDLDARCNPRVPPGEIWACASFLDGNPDRPLDLDDPDEILTL